MQLKFILIGYWHSIDESDYPNPAWFIDKEWDETIKAKIAKYLKQGQRMPYASGGRSWCRFRCGELGMGSLEFTDGKYVWPEGLAHYVEFHNVRLPDTIIGHFLNNEQVEINFANIGYDNYEIDYDWWKTQKRWNIP